MTAETEPAQAEAGAAHPAESGAVAFLFAAVVHLLLPGSGRVRINEEGWPWLDPYLIGHPAAFGWLAYLAAGLGVALAVAACVSGAHWCARRAVRHPWGKRAVGWLFVALAVVAGAWLPAFLHRFPRVWLDL
jgi:hypothetical protein